MSQGISIVIIYHDRLKNLTNTLKGLAGGTITPNEVVIIEMDTSKTEINYFGLFCIHHLLHTTDSTMLPLAEARNFGARIANYKNLVFLDVDCIPSVTFLKNVISLTPFKNALYMGKPKYLTKDKLEYCNNLEENSLDHPKRPCINQITLSKDFGLFWSLCFFISKRTFNKIQGFDERFVGYGGEDTDFALKVKFADIDFYLTPFVIYHQQHPIYSPPLNHFKAIVKNANLFMDKWGKWPMTKHLEKFKEEQLINWDAERSDPIKTIKIPSKTKINSCLQLDQPFG